MSCAGHRGMNRGMNRTASTDSLNQPPPGCVPNWNQGHPVKGTVIAFRQAFTLKSANFNTSN